MEKIKQLNDYWTRELTEVNKHIMRDCAPGDYDWNRRGIIVADDKTGELLASVKEALKYDELDAAGKVNEITVDKHWPLDCFDECWKMLLSEARRVNHGLLVVNVNDIRIFDHCWCIKQLAKQEDPALKFNEYVLLVIKDIPWAQVKEYANEHDKGEFNAVMDCFYHRVYFESLSFLEPMENVNYIYGKTTDRKPITLDGFRVESFMIYGNKSGEEIVDIYFKSGEEVSVYVLTDQGDSIPDSLADCMIAAKQNTEILTRPHPLNLIGCDTFEGINYFFDGNAVDYYITDRDSGEDMVELHFASGNVIKVLNALDENLYPGESVETLVDGCICRYFGDKD